MKILIGDNESEIVNYMKEALSDAGHSVDAALGSFARVFGADEFLEKPFTLEEVERIVHKHTQRGAYQLIQ